MYCSNCGHECSATDAFCCNCGNKIVSKSEANEKNIETQKSSGSIKGDFVGELVYSIFNKGAKQVFCIASLVMTLFFLINISSLISDWLLIITALLIVYICIKEKPFFSTEMSLALSAYALSFLTIDIPHIINRISKKTNTKYSIVTFLFHVLIYMVVTMYFYCKSEVKKAKTDSIKILFIVSILLELFSALWLIRVTYWKSIFLGMGYVIFGAILLYFINLFSKNALAIGEQNCESSSDGAVAAGELFNAVAEKVIPSKIKDKYPNTAPGIILGIVLAIVIVLIGTSIKLISSSKERKNENTNETYYVEQDNSENDTESNQTVETYENASAKSLIAFREDQLNGVKHGVFVKKEDAYYAAGIGNWDKHPCYYWANIYSSKTDHYQVFQATDAIGNLERAVLSKSNGDELIIFSDYQVNEFHFSKAEEYGYSIGFIEVNGGYGDLNGEVYAAGDDYRVAPMHIYGDDLELFFNDQKYSMKERFNLENNTQCQVGYRSGTKYIKLDVPANRKVYKVFAEDEIVLDVEYKDEQHASVDVSPLPNGIYGIKTYGVDPSFGDNINLFPDVISIVEIVD